MMNRLSLRLRIFLIFAGMAAVIILLIGIGLFFAAETLLGAGPDYLGAGPPGMTDALVLAGLVGGLGSVALIAGVWYLFDTHVALAIERLAGGLLTGAEPEPDEGRYLADLAPAVRAATAAQARARDDLEQVLEVHAEAEAREKAMLEKILSDIGAGAILTGPDGHVLFYNAAAAQLLPGLGLDRDLGRYLRPGGIAAARARIEAGADATDVALIGMDGARMSGRLRRLADEDGGVVLILRPAQRDMTQSRALLEAVRRHAAALTPLLDDLSGPLPEELNEVIRVEGRGLSTALRDLESALTPPAPRQRRVAAEELARGLGLPLGVVEPLTLAADGWQIGGLLTLLGARLAEEGRSPTASVNKRGDEAQVRLGWSGDALRMGQLDAWLAEAPDPDHPELDGAAILASHGTGIWPEADGRQGWLVLPLGISSTPREARPAVTYDFALAGQGAPDSRPLKALTCVVFDTETTGLSVSDRIVQIAGLRIAGGRLTGEQFETLVNPGRPIPPASTKIHGITDDMVADAPDMSAALRDFHHFAEGAVLIAHNAPFDMGLLRMAEGETGQHFPNRVMDTVLLSAMIWGQASQHSLDAICERLGITIPDGLRHTAMGDAEATARAFLKMLPALEAKGITRFEHVLGQAQKYRRLLSDANLASAHPAAGTGGTARS